MMSIAVAQRIQFADQEGGAGQDFLAVFGDRFVGDEWDIFKRYLDTLLALNTPKPFRYGRYDVTHVAQAFGFKFLFRWCIHK